MKKCQLFVSLTFAISLAACSTSPKEDPSSTQANDAKPTLVEMVASTSPQLSQPPTPTAAEKIDHAKVEAKLAPVKEAVEKVKQEVEHKKEIHHTAAGIEPEKALKWLKNGNLRFTKGNLRNDGQSKKDIEKLVVGQKPHSIILSCSDSRVPPELVFDQKLGEIFVVRTAGETIDPTSIASIEYAVEHLGSRNIIVLGHTQCGAVKAALATQNGQDAGSANLNKLVADIHPRIKNYSEKSHSEGYAKESWANAKGVASDLLGRSEILASKVKSGELKITAALYNLNTGIVDFE